MPNDFIIKPDGLFPSTYSQMGRVLIPSKNCDNRKIARKYTEKGATSVLDTQTGTKTISTPYISTFKRFDRPSPLISLDCQNCQIVSVPSVTDKTIYPCSLDKYSVTGYTDAKNKIDVLGNPIYPRITTSDYQLYQQYRVTEKNNIINNNNNTCCNFELTSGIYLSNPPQPAPFNSIPIIVKNNCEICIPPRDNVIFSVSWSGTECIWNIESSESSLGSLTLTITSNNKFTLEGSSIPDSIDYEFIEPSSLSARTIQDKGGEFIKQVGICENSQASITYLSPILTITDDGITTNYTEGFFVDNEIYVFNKLTHTYYEFIKDISLNSFKITNKFNCDCSWDFVF